ncbi:MAG: tyrosine-type recombinase/integrase [Clostridia bacterium]|nr:tyrosine-type recombinase/integrase [Clostridia bacterium]
MPDHERIHNLHPHKLRHTFASIAITNGADVASVSETLGHSDKAVTLRMYTHANEESKRKVSNLVE